MEQEENTFSLPKYPQALENYKDNLWQFLKLKEGCDKLPTKLGIFGIDPYKQHDEDIPELGAAVASHIQQLHQAYLQYALATLTPQSIIYHAGISHHDMVTQQTSSPIEHETQKSEMKESFKKCLNTLTLSVVGKRSCSFFMPSLILVLLTYKKRVYKDQYRYLEDNNKD